MEGRKEKQEKGEGGEVRREIEKEKGGKEKGFTFRQKLTEKYEL